MEWHRQSPCGDLAGAICGFPSRFAVTNGSTEACAFYAACTALGLEHLLARAGLFALGLWRAALVGCCLHAYAMHQGGLQGETCVYGDDEASQLDKENRGKVTAGDIKDALVELGTAIDEEDVQEGDVQTSTHTTNPRQHPKKPQHLKLFKSQ